MRAQVVLGMVVVTVDPTSAQLRYRAAVNHSGTIGTIRHVTGSRRSAGIAADQALQQPGYAPMVDLARALPKRALSRNAERFQNR